MHNLKPRYVEGLLSSLSKIPRFRRNRLEPLAALLDQAWLSFLNFAVSIAFIRGGDKSTYGSYLLLLSPLYLIQGIQNAGVISPLATFWPKASSTEQSEITSTAKGLNISLALICALLGVIGLEAYSHLNHLALSNSLTLCFGLVIVGNIARESQRSLAYVQGRGRTALKGDLIYGVILLSGVLLAISLARITVQVVFLLTGLAALGPLALRRSQNKFNININAAAQFWSCGRWALPSVVVTWLSLSSYPYFAGKYLGISAVADIGASRLLLVPLGLVTTAWGNWYRPKISGWMSKGEVRLVVAVTHRSLTIAIAAMALLSLLILFAYPELEAMLGEKYKGLQTLMLLWLLFFSLGIVRNIYMATLMSDADGYRTLHHITWLGMGVSLLGLVLFSRFSASCIVAVLCVVELVQSGLVVNRARRRWNALALY